MIRRPSNKWNRWGTFSESQGQDHFPRSLLLAFSMRIRGYLESFSSTFIPSFNGTGFRNLIFTGNIF